MQLAFLVSLSDGLCRSAMDLSQRLDTTNRSVLQFSRETGLYLLRFERNAPELDGVHERVSASNTLASATILLGSLDKTS